MTSMELLDAMASVNEKYILEAHASDIPHDNIVPIRHVSLKRRMLLAALVAVMLMLAGCAVVLMRLRELKIGEHTYQPSSIENTSETQIMTKDLISMQGFMGSDNYQAAKEWNDFLKNYDTDEDLLKKADTDEYQESMEYMAYTCYTQEMQDKIDEICDKYELEILGPAYTNMYVIMDMYEIDWQKAVGSGKLFNETANVPTEIAEGYFYRDGTFQLSGTTTLNYEGSPWIYPVNYQYRCVMKTAFDTVCLTVGNIANYEEWTYTLQDGSEVLLALSPEKALIIADKDTHFVTVNVMNTRVGDVLYGEQQMDKAGLEAFAETFSFAYEPCRPDEDMLIPPEWFTKEGENQNRTTETMPEQSFNEKKVKDIVYHLELSALGKEYRDMKADQKNMILDEYDQLLDGYSLMARESTDGESKYIVGVYDGNVEDSPLHTMYAIQEDADKQFLYNQSDSEAVEKALAEQKTPDTGYWIDNSFIHIFNQSEIIFIEAENVTVTLDRTMNRYVHSPKGREYIKDAASRGINLNNATGPYLCVYLVSEEYGEIFENIPLSEEEAAVILSEERVELTEGFGFTAELYTDEYSKLYTERTGIPSTVIDLAVEKCGYKFADPSYIRGDISEARLDCGWIDNPLYVDESDLERLKEILVNAEFGYVGACGYDAKLTLTLTGGEKMTVLKGCDGCDTIVFGSYGGYFLGDEENIEFWEMFGLDAETHEQIGEDAGKIEK